MTRFHFKYAVDTYELIKEIDRARYNELSVSLGLSDSEIEDWSEAAGRMYIPYDDALSIHKQDDSFLYRNPIDMDKVARNTDIRDIMHPLNLWRIQVIKQADVVLMDYMLPEVSTKDQKRRNFDYYEPKCNHGSSLSPCIHGIIAAELGYQEKAWDFFLHTAQMDLSDFKNNSWKGLHTACLGGTWLMITSGFAGLKRIDGRLSLSPVIPAHWKKVTFQLQERGNLLKISFSKESIEITLLNGSGAEILLNGEILVLTPSESSHIKETPNISEVVYD